MSFWGFWAMLGRIVEFVGSRGVVGVSWLRKVGFLWCWGSCWGWFFLNGVRGVMLPGFVHVFELIKPGIWHNIRQSKPVITHQRYHSSLSLGQVSLRVGLSFPVFDTWVFENYRRGRKLTRNKEVIQVLVYRRKAKGVH